jgi:DNA-binding XRE family transcriptional regulator
MIRFPSSQTTSPLIARFRLALGLSQGDLAKALSVTRRTVGRWEGRQSAPSFDQLGKLAVMAHPKAPDLARELADEAGTTMEQLGLVVPKAPDPSPAHAAPPSPPAPLPRAFPPVELMIDSILHVAARALDGQMASVDPVGAVQRVLRVAFERARGLGLTVEELDAAFSPPRSDVSSKGAPSRTVVATRKA